MAKTVTWGAGASSGGPVGPGGASYFNCSACFETIYKPDMAEVLVFCSGPSRRNKWGVDRTAPFLMVNGFSSFYDLFILPTSDDTSPPKFFLSIISSLLQDLQRQRHFNYLTVILRDFFRNGIFLATDILETAIRHVILKSNPNYLAFLHPLF